HAPTVESSPDDAQNRNSFVTKTKASSSIISPKSFIKFVKAKDSPTNSKTDKAEIAKQPPVKYAEQYRKPTKKPNEKNTEDLNKKITKLNEALSDRLSQVEARLVEFNNQEIKFGEEIRGLEFNVKSKNNRIGRLTNELEELKKEKKVLFPPSAQVYSPFKKDMSWTRLPEFIDDTITDYSRPSPSIESNSSDLQDSNSFVSEHGESSSSIMSKPKIKFVKAADCPRVIKNNKTKTARKSPVKYAEMYKNTSKSPKVRGNQRN
nr:hypothetical protein [Tanacetum cinerariifolium]